MYRLIFRLVFARMDPERAHRLGYDVIRLLPRTGLGRLVQRICGPDPRLAVRTLGLTFPSPFGLAAGFDKDARAIRGLGQFGFGHVEIGTVTARAQEGNPTPRLFRLIADAAVVNRMGFNNRGADAAALELRRVRRVRSLPIIGVNIGKSRIVEVENAEADYRISARTLSPLADYMVVNVSSPNTPGLRGLQELDKLEPLLVKIAPDLGDQEVLHLAELAVRLGLEGIIATNTTISRSDLLSEDAVVQAAGAGGLSGRPLAARSLEVLRLLRSVVPAELCVISVGGVETGADVRARLAAGATLVQGYTGYLYHGPFWARSINRELAKSLP